ncbi:EAL domain-containing protein [Shewanella sp. 3B26]|uniref:EAL domain-containing protein n=1 Tax=Shewanella zhuhaiensis TaxID=2919576 RepID=A0AAJ1BGG1_9GAMM|nr:EAL domain-containing protein [Shewanella zhuhaiensis]MCH4294312.1 EAL domain-containing protein [Shewanella zhuhaiensis]
MSSPATALMLGCEFQPLVCLQTGKPRGYEALARFYAKDGSSIAPNRVFDCLHACPAALAETEFAAKRLQLSLAPKGAPLFVNLDPHSLTPELQGALLPMLQARGDLVVELIENTCISDALMALSLQSSLQAAGIAVALDDIGAPHAMLSLELLSRVDWIKFDRHWLNRLHIGPERKLLESLVGYAHSTGKFTVIEGIETEQQRQAVAAIGFTLAQGFLFQAQFIKPMVKELLSDKTVGLLDELAANNISAGMTSQNCA